MSIASAMLCVTALASLDPSATSLTSGVVGYQTQNVGKDEYNMVTPTFVSPTGSVLRLKDVLLKSGNATALGGGNNTIYLFGNAGDPLLIVDDATLEEFSPAAYAEFGDPDDEYGTEFTFVSSSGHWYLTADSTYKYPMDDYPLADGIGLYLKASRTLARGMSSMFGGAVNTEDIEIGIGKDEYVMTGNATPASLALSEFTIASGNATALGGGNNTIFLFGNAGDPLLLADDDVMADNFAAAYAEFGDPADEFGVEFTFVASSGHWYLTADSTYKYPMDDYPIAAGQGLYVKASRTLARGLTFTIPGVTTE